MAGFETITFLSDYGTADEFVGVVKSVIRELAPGVVVLDLTHEVPPHDVRAGALTLARAMQYVAPGVVLAVVDPGVGTERKAVAVEVAEGAGVLVGPDNGLLAPAVAMAGGATRAVELTDPEYHLPAPGPTFAGRDVFAPVAAHLCNGVPLLDLGPALDPALLLPGIVPVSREEEGRTVAEVLWVDRFGNAQLNLGPEDLPGTEEQDCRFSVRVEGRNRTVGLAATYGAIRPGEVALVVDSYGLLSLAADRSSAAAELGLDAGTEVSLVALEDDGVPAGTRTSVHLGPRPA
jgi:S-adenosylmethionine hydrolase